MSPTVKTILVWALILAAALGLWNLVEQRANSDRILNLTDFLGAVDGGRVAAVTIRGNSVKGTLQSSESFQTTLPADYVAIYDRLAQAKVKITILQEPESVFTTNVLIWFMSLFVAFSLGWRAASWVARQRNQTQAT